MSTRYHQTMRSALVFSAIAAAYAIGAWSPGNISSRPTANAAVPGPDRAAEVERIDAELRKLLYARHNEVEKEVQDYERNLEHGVSETLAFVTHYRRLLVVTLDLSADPKVRANLLRPVLNRVKKLESICERQIPPQRAFQNGRMLPSLSPAQMIPVNIFRMEVEIEILKAKRAETVGR